MKMLQKLSWEWYDLTGIDKFQVIATFIGLLVDMIALVGLISVSTASSSNNLPFVFSNSDVFAVILISLFYFHGLMNSRINNRWKENTKTKSYDDVFSFPRRSLIAILLAYPFALLFIYSLSVSFPSIQFFITDSKLWNAAIMAFFMSFFYGPGITIIGYGFDTILEAIG